MKTFELEIVTPERKVYKGAPYSLIVPAYTGYLGIMANHAPFLGILGKGKVTIRIETSDAQIYEITGGLIDVGANKVTILADEAK